MIEQLGDVLHRHQIRSRLIDESGEIRDEIPFRVVSLLSALPAVGRKWLTGGAACKQGCAVFRPKCAKIVALHVVNVTPDEFGRVVSLEWKPAFLVNVDPCHDGNP